MARDRLWIYISVIVLSMIDQCQSATSCPRGYYLYPTAGRPCVPCPVGYFMPEEDNSHDRCYTCTVVETPILESLVSDCNKTHDAGIRCLEGYYRTQPSYPQDRGHCLPCTKCPFPKRRCQHFNDTVCCPGDDYRVVVGKDGKEECVRECGRDQYLNFTSNKCLSCPYNTYMEELKHANTNCTSCDNPTSKKQIIVRPCNSTHPTIFGCADGFVQQSNDEQNTSHVECKRFCGRGEFVHSETETCLPCHKNTYMDEDLHSHTARCKPCRLPRLRNEAIIQACNSTHPAIIGCITGFYRRLSQDLTTSICAPCRDCSENTDGNVFVGRACGLTDDTICCGQPNMDVVGSKCTFLPKIVLCGEGQYLFENATTHSAVCKLCPRGTYMDQTNHTANSCKSCEDFSNVTLCSSGRDNYPNTSMDKGLPIILVIVGVLVLIGLGVLWKACRKHQTWTSKSDVETAVRYGVGTREERERLNREIFVAEQAEPAGGVEGDIPLLDPHEQDESIETANEAQDEDSTDNLAEQLDHQTDIGSVKPSADSSKRRGATRCQEGQESGLRVDLGRNTSKKAPHMMASSTNNIDPIPSCPIQANKSDNEPSETEMKTPVADEHSDSGDEDTRGESGKEPGDEKTKHGESTLGSNVKTKGTAVEERQSAPKTKSHVQRTSHGEDTTGPHRETRTRYKRTVKHHEEAAHDGRVKTKYMQKTQHNEVTTGPDWKTKRFYKQMTRHEEDTAHNKTAKSDEKPEGNNEEKTDSENSTESSTDELNTGESSAEMETSPLSEESRSEEHEVDDGDSRQQTQGPSPPHWISPTASRSRPEMTLSCEGLGHGSDLKSEKHTEISKMPNVSRRQRETTVANPEVPSQNTGFKGASEYGLQTSQGRKTRAHKIDKPGMGTESHEKETTKGLQQIYPGDGNTSKAHVQIEGPASKIKYDFQTGESDIETYRSDAETAKYRAQTPALVGSPAIYNENRSNIVRDTPRQHTNTPSYGENIKIPVTQTVTYNKQLNTHYSETFRPDSATDSLDNDKHDLLETRYLGWPTVQQHDSSRAQKGTTEQVAQRGKYEQKKYTRDEKINNSVAQRAGYQQRPSFDEDTGSHDLLTKEPDVGTIYSPRPQQFEEEISACGSHAEMFHGREPRPHEEIERHRMPVRSDGMQTRDQTEGTSMAVRSSSLSKATSCNDVETRMLPAQIEQEDNNTALISKTTRLNNKTGQARAQTEGHKEKLCRSDVQPRHEESLIPEVKTTEYEGQLTAGNESQTNGDPQMEELVPDELQQTVRGQGMSDKPTVRDQVRQKATETSESAGPDSPSLPELKVSVSVLELSSVGPEPSPDLVFNVEIPRAVLSLIQWGNEERSVAHGSTMSL